MEIAVLVYIACIYNGEDDVDNDAISYEHFLATGIGDTDDDEDDNYSLFKLAIYY